MSFVVHIAELVVHGRFGPIGKGATQPAVLDALGEPDARNALGVLPENVSIWVYGKSLCNGHLEFHFLSDKLWMIFADYMPLRRYRSAVFRFEPGCLGGRAFPAVAEVIQALGSGGAPAPRFERLDPRWSDPPPPTQGPRIATRAWNQAVRKAHAKDQDVDSASYGQLIWTSGTALGVGYHHAVTASGERLVSEDLVLVMTVPMLLEDSEAV